MRLSSIILISLLLAAASRCLAAQAESANPVAVMIKEEYDSTNEQAEYWGAADESIFEAMASSAAVRAPGSREALWTALRSGQVLAAGVLWRLDPDPKIVDFLIDAMRRDDFRPPFGRDEIPFVLGYTRDRRALPALWAEVSDASSDPYRQCVCAKAIYRISRDPKAAELLRRIRRTTYPPVMNHESYPQDMAKTALEDLGLESAPKKIGRENR